MNTGEPRLFPWHRLKSNAKPMRVSGNCLRRRHANCYSLNCVCQCHDNPEDKIAGRPPKRKEPDNDDSST